MGMLRVHVLFISNEHIRISAVILIDFRSVINCTELLTLNMYGNLYVLLRNFVKKADLYTGAFRQLITGLIGLLFLCNFLLFLQFHEHHKISDLVARSGLVLSLLVNDMPTLSRYVELPLYADDTALIFTSRKPSLLVSYMETYLGRLSLYTDLIHPMMNYACPT
jgi:hypothetical protein